MFYLKTYSVACGSLGIPPTKISPAVQEYRDEDRSNPTRVCIL